MDRRVDVNLRYYYGVEPDLNLDTEEGYDSILKKLMENKEVEPDQKALISECQFFSNKLKLEGVSALYLASENGHTATVKFLIERGAQVDLNCPGHNHQGTSLHAAAEKGHNEVVELLIQHGARCQRLLRPHAVAFSYLLWTFRRY